MVFAYIGIAVLWIFLFCYIIVASIDFGAGFFTLHAKITKQDKKINHLIARYLNPVWEVTNVFFVFFFVGMVGFFPDSAKYFGTVLLVPASIALVLLSIRGGFYAFENYGPDTKLPWLAMYGLAGLFIPAALATTLTITACVAISLYSFTRASFISIAITSISKAFNSLTILPPKRPKPITTYSLSICVLQTVR